MAPIPKDLKPEPIVIKIPQPTSDSILIYQKIGNPLQGVDGSPGNTYFIGSGIDDKDPGFTIPDLSKRDRQIPVQLKFDNKIIGETTINAICTAELKNENILVEYMQAALIHAQSQNNRKPLNFEVFAMKREQEINQNNPKDKTAPDCSSMNIAPQTGIPTILAAKTVTRS